MPCVSRFPKESRLLGSSVVENDCQAPSLSPPRLDVVPLSRCPTFQARDVMPQKPPEARYAALGHVAISVRAGL